MHAAVVPRQQYARGAGNERQGMLVHMNTIIGRVISAGRVVPRKGGCRGRAAIPKPDFKRVEENTIGVIRIHGQALIVPILRVVAIGELAVFE